MESYFLSEIVGFDLEEVALYLQISKRMVPQYFNKLKRIENVSTAVIGRPYGCISMHPHKEFVIMELLLQYSEKTIAKMVDEV